MMEAGDDLERMILAEISPQRRGNIRAHLEVCNECSFDIIFQYLCDLEISKILQTLPRIDNKIKTKSAKKVSFLQRCNDFRRKVRSTTVF